MFLLFIVFVYCGKIIFAVCILCRCNITGNDLVKPPQRQTDSDVFHDKSGLVLG